MNAPVQIRRPEVVEEIRELARLRGVGVTEAVAELVHRELQAIKQAREEKMQNIRKLLAEFDALPRVGPVLTDDDIYDEEGFPKSWS